MYVLLLRTLYPQAPGLGAPFVAVLTSWDTDRRTYYRAQQDSQNNDPFELPADTEVQRYEVRPGLVRVVRYVGNGSGQVYTENVGAATGGGGSSSPNLAVQLNVNGTYVSGPGKSDASVDATGSQGKPPYQVSIALASGGPPIASGTSPSQYYPYRLHNLPGGDFVVSVTDATGSTATLPFRIDTPSVPRQGAGIALRDDYDGDPQTGSGTQWFWILNDLTIEQTSYSGGGSGDINGDHYQRPAGELVDAYLLPDGTTWRKVFSDGAPYGPPPDVYFEDSDINEVAAGSGGLELDNIIQFDPDSAAEQNGGFLVEVSGTAPPFLFSLPGHGSNQTGSFDGLGAGDYVVAVADQVGSTLTVPITLAVRYGPRWSLVFDDLYGVPCRVELWLKGYAGPVEDICGQANPVVLKSDGLSSSQGGQGDVPPVIGRSAQLDWLVPIDTFADVVAGISATDRYCRCDVYYDNALEFRGYVLPDIYHAPLLDGKQAISLTATDGLASLKDTYFTGHMGQRLFNHRPWLNTLLNCLSRCDVALPLRLFTNRRDAAMATSDKPELAATSNRTGYWLEDKDAPTDCRTVVDALAQALGGTLCQREGTWQIRSAQEAVLDAPGRRYLPAGTSQADTVALAPSGTITPPAYAGPVWHWVEANQAVQIRAGWKALLGSTDAGYLTNAYPAGEVFSDVNSWVENQTGLRGTARWQPGPDQVFPLALVPIGQKSSDYATIWPRSSAVNSADARYLQGPALPLVAGSEATPAYLQVTAQLVASETYLNQQGGQTASPTTAPKAYLPYEIIVDGQGLGVQVLEIAGGKSAAVTVPIPALLSGAAGATIRLGAWYAPDTNLYVLAPAFSFDVDYKVGDVVKHAYAGQGPVKLFVNRQPVRSAAPGTPGTAAFWAEISSTNQATGQLLVSTIGVQLRPQEATWDGEDNFRADGPAGTIRPTEVLKVYHADVPIKAGLYSGNLFAFGKAVALSDGTMSTRWARAVDKLGAPLFEANVLDSEALRATPSALVTGTVRFRGFGPPRLLDSLDMPTDTPGRRYFVLADEWALRQSQTALSVVDIGVGAGVTNPLLDLPEGARVTHEVYAYQPGQYTPYVRLTHGGGVRVRH